MKILQINANYGFSSTGLIMKDIGEAIDTFPNSKGKCDMHAYYAYQNTNAETTNGIKIGSNLSWKLHALLCRLFGLQGYYSVISTLLFFRYLRKLKPDVIHLHNLHSNFINVPMLLRYLAKNDIATVITMHDCWWFTGKCFHYIDVNCDKFKTGCHGCPKQHALPPSYLWDCSHKIWTMKKDLLLKIPRLKIVGCSLWVCNEAKKSFLGACDISNIYNGVDTGIFHPIHDNLRNTIVNENTFLIMGMANKWLQERNVVALEKVSSIPGMKLMVVGCTTKQIEFLKESFPDVIAIGFIKGREELARYYNAADVFVNVTHADTLPTVNMESICCGTPVITYEVCGSTELVNNLTGIVVKEDDVDGLATALYQVRSSSLNQCSEIGKKEFDKNVCYRKYCHLYNSFK